jgi:hypothetical protein
MFLIIFVCGGLAILGVLVFSASKVIDMRNDFIAIVFAFLVLTIVIVLLIALCMIPIWFVSKEQARLINKRYKTEYTTREIFFAGHLVEKFIKTDKNLIDINNRFNIKGEKTFFEGKQ